jgi:uncharacterized protein (TIGR02996 family)
MAPDDCAAQLEAAAAAADAGDWKLASREIVAAWHVKRLVALGAIASELDRRGGAASLREPTVAARQEAWIALAKSGDADAVATLLATEWPVQRPHAVARVEALAARAVHDPRISTALVALHERRRYPTTEGRKLSRLIFRVLAKQRDPIATDYFERIERDGSAHEVTAMRAALGVLATRARVPIPIATPREQAALDRLAAHVAVDDRSTAARDELLAAIYAAPHDDAPRLVLADLLVEQQDPRGELIALQLGAQTPKSVARQRELVRAAGNAWFDGLDADGAIDIELARGFPVRAKTRTATFAAPAWATIERLEIDVMASQFALRDVPLLRALRALRWVPSAALARVELPAPEQLDELGMFDLETMGATTPLAPRVLVVRDPGTAAIHQLPRRLAPLRAWPVARRVAEVQLGCSIHALGTVVALLATVESLDAASLTGWLYGSNKWSARLTRDALAVTWRGDGSDVYDFKALERVLRDLRPAPHVRELAIDARGRLAKRVMPELAAAVTPIVGAWPNAPEVRVVE